MAAGLTNVLKLLPQTTMEQLSVRFNRCSLRDDSEHVANLAADLGEEGVQYLRSTVRGGPIAEAVEMAGLLSRLDPESVMVFLPGRMKDFPRTSQDRIVRQISASGAARRCHILLELLDHVDPLVTPPVRIADLFPHVLLSLNDPADTSSPDTSALMSFTPLGTASSRTLYLRGGDGSQYAVRVLGATGRTRVLRYVEGTHAWIDVL